MTKLSEKGAIHLLVPLILLLGIIGGVYLITAGPLKLFPKASVSQPISGPIPPPSPVPSPSCTLDEIRATFGARKGEPRYNPACDLNLDGRISVTDYSAFLSRPSPSPSPSPSPTPPTQGFGRAAKFARGIVPNVSRIIADGTVYSPDGPMTMEAWIRIDESLSSSDVAYLIYNRGVFNYPNGEVLYNLYYLQLRGNQLIVYVTDIPRAQKGFVNATLPRDEVGVWHHVAGVYDGQKISIFIDGNKQTETGNLTTDYPFIKRVLPFYAGAVLNSLPVTLDEVRISNIARYTSNFPRPTKPLGSDSNTLLLWHLDTMEGGIIRDSGPYGVHGEAERVDLVDSTIPSSTTSPSPTQVACTFNDLRAAFFTKRGDPKYNPACDLNNDGIISIFDFTLLRRR